MADDAGSHRGRILAEFVRESRGEAPDASKKIFHMSFDIFHIFHLSLPEPNIDT
jgi:hypothetical protein